MNLRREIGKTAPAHGAGEARLFGAESAYIGDFLRLLENHTINVCALQRQSCCNAAYAATYDDDTDAVIFFLSILWPVAQIIELLRPRQQVIDQRIRTVARGRELHALSALCIAKSM